ncbi:MAG: glycosyltransferase family 39 protein [Bdellovibrionales bacterium]|nr:glycosyltransferase family 39 protein [Bdellovibrionales bacterium]
MNIIIYSLILKLLLSAFIPINADEAYYWVWSHHMQLSFFDHPPFVAWLFWLGHPLEDIGSTVRWPGILLAHGTLFVWYKILSPILSQTQLKWWLILSVVSPFLGMGAMFITPDIPLLFFWSLSTYFFIKVLDSPNALNFSLLGAGLGFSFLSKYHTVLFFPVGIGLFFYQQKIRLKWLKYILASIFTFFICSSPVWIWNLQNDFISFKFQLNHGLGANHWDAYWTIEYILGQFFIITPFVMYSIYKKDPSKKWPLWMISFALFPLLFFLYTSLKNKVEANWTSIAYPYIYALALYGSKNIKPIKWAVGFWISFFFILLIQLAFQPLKIPGEDFKTNEITKYSEVEKLLQTDELKRSLVFARTYQMASKLSFDLKKPIYKLKGLNRRDYFDELTQSIPHSDYILIAKKDDQLPDWAKVAGHTVERIESVDDLFEFRFIKIK